MDYFECDSFDPTYFDTPDCGALPTGHRVGPMRTVPVELDEADELLALI